MEVGRTWGPKDLVSQKVHSGSVQILESGGMYKRNPKDVGNMLSVFLIYLVYLPFLLLLLLLSHFSHIRLCATSKTAAHQAPPSLRFSRQEHWSGLPFPSPMHESEKGK